MSEPQKVLPVAGAPAVFEAKARAFFKAHRDANIAKGRWWHKLGSTLTPIAGFFAAVGAAGAVGSFLGVPGAELVAFPGLFFGLPPLLIGLLAKSHGQKLLDAPEVAPDLQALLRGLARDWAARQPLDGTIDLRDAKDACPVERSATSPYSRATKNYYRHRWFRASGKLADGTVLALEGTALVKTKSGQAIRTEQQLRGRLRPGALLGTPSWREERCFGRVHALTDKRGDVLFWAPVQAMDQILPDLEALVRELVAGGPSGAVRA